MNVLRLFLVSLLLILATSAAQASNPCETLLCMAGKIQGKSGGSNCSQPISDYFSIIKFGKRGRFSPGKTAVARLSFLNSCAAPGIGDWPMQINAVYGTVLN
jgi:hypothetical protein